MFADTGQGTLGAFDTTASIGDQFSLTAEQAGALTTPQVIPDSLPTPTIFGFDEKTVMLVVVGAVVIYLMMKR